MTVKNPKTNSKTSQVDVSVPSLAMLTGCSPLIGQSGGLTGTCAPPVLLLGHAGLAVNPSVSHAGGSSSAQKPADPAIIQKPPSEASPLPVCG